MNSAEVLTVVMRERARRERHRLAYAYHLGWLVRALEMPQAWQETNAEAVRAVAVMCREERASATGESIVEADRRWGTVLERAANIVRKTAGPDGAARRGRP
jgi:hypothetical protein